MDIQKLLREEKQKNKTKNKSKNKNKDKNKNKLGEIGKKQKEGLTEKNLDEVTRGNTCKL